MQDVSDISRVKLVQFTANLAQVAGTYDLATVTNGDIVIEKFSVYVVGGATLITSVAIVTNQTNATNLMTGIEGSLASLVAQKVIPCANGNAPIYMVNGQKVRYTIVGLTGSGTLLVTFMVRPVVSGATLA